MLISKYSDKSRTCRNFRCLHHHCGLLEKRVALDCASFHIHRIGVIVDHSCRGVYPSFTDGGAVYRLL